ncbi:phosphatase 2C-like domain-containing protein [Hyaloraphidium curvatum]|nr:phosphatase 2C-like domain-containing protein [Hyaloraphidium curvatum]
MEDKSVFVDACPLGSTPPPAVKHPELHSLSALFGVVDGHGGVDVAKYVRDHFYGHFHDLATLPLDKPRPHALEAKAAHIPVAEGGVRDPLFGSFLALEKALSSDPTRWSLAQDQGAVAVFIYVRWGSARAAPISLYVGNVGDCEAVMAVGGKPDLLTTKHDSSSAVEQAAIQQRGGFVSLDQMGHHRAMGTLLPSRTLGDFRCKPWVSCIPHVARRDLGPDAHFVVLASDGLWDFLSPADAVRLVYKHVTAPTLLPMQESVLRQRLKQTAKMLVAEATNEAMKRGSVSMDNLSVMVVFFRPPPYTFDG